MFRVLRGPQSYNFRAGDATTPQPKTKITMTNDELESDMTLEQTCPPECQGAQCAFKDSMIH